jgi:hypothetical protein
VRARATRNRRLSTTANLRLAVLLGLSIFLGSNINPYLTGQDVGSSGIHWLAIAAGLLGAAAALAPWLGRRTVVTAVVLPAGVVFACEVLRKPFALDDGRGVWLAGILIAMGALVVLSGGPGRLPRSWLWLPCVAMAGLAAGNLRFSGEDYFFASVYVPGYAIALLAAVVVCWLVTDARPAFGLIAAALLTLLLWDVGTLPFVLISAEAVILVVVVLPLAIGLAVMLALGWLLHRQATASPRPLPKP